MNSGVTAFTGPADVILHALSHDLDRPVVQFADGGATISARDFRANIVGYAAALNALKLDRGARVGLIARNRVEVLYVQAAIAFTDLCLVALHPMAALDDLTYIANDADLAALIFDPHGFSHVAEALGEQRPGLRLLAFGPGPGENLITLAGLYPDAPLVAPPADPDAIIRLTYSGGTTGRPKAIMGSQRYTMTMLQIMLMEWDWPGELRQLVCSPLSHAGGSALMPALLRGGSLIVLPGFEPGAVLAAIERFRVTAILLVPAMIYALLDHPARVTSDTSSLEVIYYGASSISPPRLEEAIRAFGPVFFQFYGQAEAPMSIALLRREDHDPAIPGRLGSCGRPTPWNQVALLDDEGRAVVDGQPGEICVRGPMVMTGYLNRPDETAEAFAHGWLHTGDVAIRTADGFLRIVDRKKDMIVTGGFNVYPREIEDVLTAEPGVADAAVIGTPHPKWGEAVTAVVVPHAGATIDPEALIAAVREHKGALHAPKHLHLVDTLPRTGLGKPDKKALRAHFGSEG
ncbi:AMP-binding protein [uncultured Sphingomonas sp.]|uniref:AMP-binding protein n=1 Tax=uncultured Sphingomonas sp. TaxID=158754 RepID=UPI0026068DE9|nr:AMP-binding protein [uncultured Sphingomonas sp.]